MKNTNDSELDELELILGRLEAYYKGYDGSSDALSPREAKAQILQHYRSVRDIEGALPEKSTPLKGLKFNHIDKDAGYNHAIDDIRSSLNLDGGAEKCTCGEPHVSDRITHRYDGKPCYVTDSVDNLDGGREWVGHCPAHCQHCNPAYASCFCPIGNSTTPPQQPNTEEEKK